MFPDHADGYRDDMATRLADALPHDELRFEPTPKWVRAEREGETVVDSRRALLVWKPGDQVPGYAFPRADVRVDALPDEAVEGFDDPALAEHVAVHWDAADRWLEEEEQILGHPRNPFHRVDLRRSSRHVVVELDGEVVADSRRPTLVFETGLPVRYYLPREDVRAPLEPTDKRTQCAYKGEASYFTVSGHENVAWTYEEPLPDNRELKDLVCFFNEQCDIVVDGEPAGRPSTQWS